MCTVTLLMLVTRMPCTACQRHVAASSTYLEHAGLAVSCCSTCGACATWRLLCCCWCGACSSCTITGLPQRCNVADRLRPCDRLWC